MAELTLSVAYNESSFKFFESLQEVINDRYPNVILVGYCEDFHKEKRNAFMLKGGFSAKLLPFAALRDIESKPIKAFYTEASECTIDNITKFLDYYLLSLNTDENESSSN